MKNLNLKRNKRRKYKRKKVEPLGQPSFRRTNKKHLKRKVKGSFYTFFWRLFSSFKIPILFAFLIFSLLGYGVYWVIENQFFTIKNYEITGLDIIEEEEILSSVLGSKGKWIFFNSSTKLEQNIIERTNYVKTVYIEKRLPDTLSIHIEEREPIAVWRTVNGAYLIDDIGYIISRSISEDVTLDSILSGLNAEQEDVGSERDSDEKLVFISEETDEILENEEEKIILKEVLDPDLVEQIEMDKKSRGNEQSLLDLDFNLYNNLPDSYKKYPQVKILSDEIYEVDTTIDWRIWGSYSSLLSNLSQINGFEANEILIFSQTKVLVLLENGKRAYFRLDQDIVDQVYLLEFVYGRLMIESIEFSEIDLRFKRPVIRQ